MYLDAWMLELFLIYPLSIDPCALLPRGNAGFGAFHGVSDAGGLTRHWITESPANVYGRGVGLGTGTFATVQCNTAAITLHASHSIWTRFRRDLMHPFHAGHKCRA